MHWQHTPYTIPLLLSATTAAAGGLLILKYRAAAGALALSILFAAVATWAFEYAMEMGGVNRSFKMFWANLQYISISAVPILWLTFALQYSDRTMGSGQIPRPTVHRPAHLRRHRPNSL